MVYGLGSNMFGQLGGEDFVLAVNTDNNVIFSFGRNNRGQLGRHVDMDVFGWGCNREGQVGCGNKKTLDKLNNSISFEKSFDVINKLGEGGYGQICDFGLAKEVPNCDPFLMSKAKHTADVGTVYYMAPEAQTNEYNHLIDIYSLSLIGSQIFGFVTNDIIDGKPQILIHKFAVTM
ncbi:unnamed protein product [Oppiella nova]|uniref:Protein kinase domain-containing protein n=1 Tax=Oppiella nova TaxID=334625 RepID=A0A7R9LQ64_9ACAR|nr:unnamed protein product [Oppiella nova]CAG2165162.1 unnamed protein product [Oppiella nova]